MFISMAHLEGTHRRIGASRALRDGVLMYDIGLRLERERHVVFAVNSCMAVLMARHSTRRHWHVWSTANVL